MRRLLSLVLLLVFGLPVVAPALGLNADAQSDLPMCCRRNGAHHCMLSAAEKEASLDGQQVTVVRSKCPYCPTAPVSMHHELLALHTGTPVLPALFSQSANILQIEAWARAAEAGARHKRGPPVERLS